MHRRLLLGLIALLLVIPVSSHAASTRIVGGTEAVPGAHPFMAAILESSDPTSQFCGGSLVSSTWVISAAHCFVDNGSVTPASGVRIGLGLHRLSSGGGTIHTVKRIIIHPQYNAQTSDNDIALIELNTASSQAPITVNTGSTNLTGTTATAIGWGLTIPGNDNSSSDVLRQVDVPVVSNTTCDSAYGGGITSNMVCAGFTEGGKDACQGDSGGPLVATVDGALKLIGVTSFGNGCADPNSFGVYSRLSAFESFIAQYITLTPPVATDGKYGLWNGFLGMTNILELINRSGSAITAQVNMHSSTGTLISSTYIYVAAGAQQDVILNQLSGFAADAYGLVQVSSNVEGRVLFYRASDTAGTSFDYVFAVPLKAPSTGGSFVGFNTYQPSVVPSEQGNVVANWLSVVNLESSAKSFTIRKFDEVGALLSESTVSINAKSRSDFEAGHVVPGSSRIGLIQVEPLDSSAGYLSQLMRYGSAANNRFDFAFPLLATAGSADTTTVPLGSSFSAQNYLEVINVADASNFVAVEFYNASGSLLTTQTFTLSARGQFHINVNAILGDFQIGYARISSGSGLPIVAESMFYYRNASGGITSMYGSQAGLSPQGTKSGSFNLYLGMQNYLRVSNPNDTTVAADLTISGFASAGSSRTLTLPGNSTVELSLHDTATYGTATDSYGTVVITPPSSTTKLVHEILRLKQETSSEVQFTAPTGLE